jgi:hypothetical protein
MNTDIATTLTAAMNRAVDQVVDGIASDGLKVLKSVLDSSGFSKSEYLKNYEIFAHVSGQEVTFEILLDVEAVEPEDEITREAMNEQLERAQEKASRTYRMSSRGVQRVEDARRPARDARRPARDARKTAQDRLIEHEIALRAPRSARITRTGKLAVALKRSVRSMKEKTVFPEADFQGIIGKFMKEIESTIADRFIPELGDIIQRHASE